MTPKDEGWTALHLSCRVHLLDKGNNEMFKYLLSLGADPYIRNKHGASMMHKAAKDDNTSLLTFLRDKLNFSVNEKDYFDNTPLHYACFENTIYSAYWLIGFGQDVNAQNKENDTPLHCLLRSKKKLKNTKIVRDLIFKGADRELENKSGFKPLDLIESNKCDESIKKELRMILGKQPLNLSCFQFK